MRTKFLSVSLLFVCFTASAQQGAFDDKFRFSIGVFRAEVDTSIKWDSVNLPGTEFGFEQTLGVDENESTLNLGFEWRFFPKHAFNVRYFNLERSGGDVADFDLVINGITIPVQTAVNAFFDTEVFELSYAFAPIKRDNMILDLTFGLSIQDISLGITASAIDFDERSTITAPLPTIGIGWGYAFNEKWLIRLNGGWFQVKVDNIDGKITELSAGVEWRPFKNVGFELAYNRFDLNVSVEDTEDGFLGELDYDYKGPILGVTARF